MVVAQEGRRNRARAELSQRFQLAIDEAAMRAGLEGTEQYLDEWRKSDWMTRDGAPQEVADAVCAELESEYSRERIRQLLEEFGAAGQS